MRDDDWTPFETWGVVFIVVLLVVCALGIDFDHQLTRQDAIYDGVRKLEKKNETTHP